MKATFKKMSARPIALLLGVALISCSSMLYYSCTHQPYVLPVNLRTGDPNICFERDVLPIFQSNCARSGCHNSPRGAKGYVLDSYDNIIKKGIIPGNPAASIIWQSVSMNKFGVEHMPQDAPGLTTNQLYLIRRWIVTGAIDSGGCNVSNCDTSLFTYSGAVQPIMQNNCTGCHNSASAAGGSLADYSSVMNAAVNGRLIGDIKHLTGYNAMPLGGAMLQDCQITQIEKWVLAGAPNN